jgi:hypothetical protein
LHFCQRLKKNKNPCFKKPNIAVRRWWKQVTHRHDRWFHLICKTFQLHLSAAAPAAICMMFMLLPSVEKCVLYIVGGDFHFMYRFFIVIWTQFFYLSFRYREFIYHCEHFRKSLEVRSKKLRESNFYRASMHELLKITFEMPKCWHCFRKLIHSISIAWF